MMIGATDYIGISTLITSACVGVASIIAAFQARRAKANTTVNGGDKPLGQYVEEVHAAVSTPPGTPPLGEVVADAVHQEPWDGIDRRTPPEGTPKVGG